ncbi:MAG: class I SAM-dependent methyltransferase [Clostridia bacterium]|nr:class I SAM-dependent methyltransferase [Clostridia bacterium]
MLEKMDEFFRARLEGYDAHMKEDIEGAREFYPFTAAQLPAFPGAKVLDLGCGTGLELEDYFRLNPTAEVTGIDLSAAMLEKLREKFPGKKLKLICASYFDIPFGEAICDAAVSVESLHHFNAEKKLSLYRRLYAALTACGVFILTDYFSVSEEEEAAFFREYEALCTAQGAEKSELYHFDTPLTVHHEMQLLNDAGFSEVEILGHWGATHVIRACKGSR